MTRLTPLLLSLGLFALPPSVGAQDTSAEALAREALQASRRGDLAVAIEKYREALEIDPELNGARFELARLYATAGQFDESRREFALLILVNPEDSASRRGEVTALTFLGRWEDARRKLEEGLAALPRDGQLAHLLARILASAPTESARDGQLALRLAEKVFEIQQIAAVRETLAMAWAETGQFDRATGVQATAVSMLEESGDAASLDLARRRLDAYRERKPWRIESPIELVLSTELPSARR